MVDKLTVTNASTNSTNIRPVSGDAVKTGQTSTQAPSTDFAELLRQKGIQLSNHANNRIQSRNIPTNADNISRLQSAIDKAIAKGAKECLVLLDNTAYLVALKNLPDGKTSQTVVTVISKDELQERIFTSIDSVVIA